MCLHKTRLFRRTKIIVGDAIDFSEYYDRRMTAEDYAAAEEVIRARMLSTRSDYLAAQEEAGARKKAEKRKRKENR